MPELRDDAMNVDDRANEVQDALETTDQLHHDIARLKRLGIMTPRQDQVTQGQLDEIVATVTEKLAVEGVAEEKP